ncbi:MAG: hypothetical protein WAU32_10855, partial [Thermoanaerobaculia bacterium]
MKGSGIWRIPRGLLAAVALLLLASLMYTLPGLLPGRVLLPLDLVEDMGLWKPEPSARVAVSNRLLSDPVLLYRPSEVQMRRSLSEGRFPWTNPYAGSGTPLFADPQIGLLSPYTWLRIPWEDSGWALSVTLKLVVAGLGVFVFARSLGASWGQALLSGLVYEMSGYSILWALHPQTNVFAFLPWLAAASRRLWIRPSGGSVLEVFATAALATSGGHPETLAFGAGSIGLFLILQHRAERPADLTKSQRRGPLLTALACASGLLLVAIQLVPFALLLPESWITENRARGLQTEFQPYAIAGQILPGFLGSPLAGELDLSGAFFGSGNLHMRSAAFVGFLALVALVLAARSLRPIFRRCLWVAAAALAVAWGVPPLGWVWDRIPLLRLFAAQYAAAAFVLFASVAVGPAVAELAGARRFGVVGIALCAGGLVLVATGIAPSLAVAKPALSSFAREAVGRLRREGHLKQDPAVYDARFSRYLEAGRSTALRRAALPGIFWALGGVAFLTRRRRLALMTCAIVGELATFGFGYLPAVDRTRLPEAPPALESIRRSDPGSTRMLAAAVDVFPPDLATLERLRDVRSFDVLESRAWSVRLRRCGYDEVLRGFPERLTEDVVGCLRDLGVGHVLTRYPPPGAARIGGLPPPAVGVYELPPGPRAPAPHLGPPRGIA